ncbi:hypothetical protein NDU88_005727 [Pleurodeles waltl]|uniref:Uncharacterized protein n=1 Tax=Pleurodeles waltl TaxID=8319 RepID=A0AAV7RJG4_PLEWA|nr:hypothetical protein NDU88_005727 [Pleurodeles waltl]
MGAMIAHPPVPSTRFPRERENAVAAAPRGRFFFSFPPQTIPRGGTRCCLRLTRTSFQLLHRSLSRAKARRAYGRRDVPC